MDNGCLRAYIFYRGPGDTRRPRMKDRIHKNNWVISPSTRGVRMAYGGGGGGVNGTGRGWIECVSLFSAVTVVLYRGVLGW